MFSTASTRSTLAELIQLIAFTQLYAESGELLGSQTLQSGRTQQYIDRNYELDESLNKASFFRVMGVVCSPLWPLLTIRTSSK